MVKLIFVYIFAVFLCIVLIPALVTVLFGRFNEGYMVYEQPQRRDTEQVFALSRLIAEDVTVYERLAYFEELEDYIVMVVAAEMPASFHLEALKAQAVAARTYAVNQLIENPGVYFSDLWQAYTNEEALRALWGVEFDFFMGRIRQSVEETRGEIMASLFWLYSTL
jgi:stage II sporulation protein D